MKALLNEIRSCTICKDLLPHSPNPILSASAESKILIIGQAPGRKVHESGVPWDDQSGDLLREWLGITNEIFYNEHLIALVPMGFCYPGKGKTGDLPPRPECAEAWHKQLLSSINSVKLTLLIGQYAQKQYLKGAAKSNLTETVRSYEEYLPDLIPLPHPSPLNRRWLKKNDWFERDLVPQLKEIVSKALRR